MNEDESYIKRYGTTIEKYNLACNKAVEYTQVRYREGYRAGIEAGKAEREKLQELVKELAEVIEGLLDKPNACQKRVRELEEAIRWVWGQPDILLLKAKEKQRDFEAEYKAHDQIKEDEG